MAQASLLAPMDKMLRQVSFQSTMNSLYAHLMKGQKTRLAFDEMGMTSELRERIASNMMKHKVTTDTWGNVKKLNIEKWDRKTADDMMDALTVNSNRQVQKTIAGEQTAITSHPVGRVFLQFRTFAIDSYAKHLRADIRSAMNGQALRVMLSNMHAMILAGVAYSARTSVSTVGLSESDRQEMLNDRLSPERFAANVAAYTPSTGVAVTMWNMSAGTMFPDHLNIPVSRASGLQNDIAGNPSFDAANRVTSLFQDVGDTEPESILTKGRFAIPFQNTIWGDMILNNAARLAK